MLCCRIRTCSREAGATQYARGLCVPHAWGWYLSHERREHGLIALERFTLRWEALDMLRGLPMRIAEVTP